MSFMQTWQLVVVEKLTAGRDNALMIRSQMVETCSSLGGSTFTPAVTTIVEAIKQFLIQGNARSPCNLLDISG